MAVHFEVQAPGLRTAREARGLNRAELALLAGSTSVELAAIEEGVRRPTDDGLRVRLLRALDAEFGDVFEVVGVDRFGRPFRRAPR